MPTRIIVNARHLTQSLTGVQRFAHEISRELASIRDDIEFVAPPAAVATDDFPVTTVGSRSGHLWEQVELPRYLKRRGTPLLVNLMSTGPLSYRNQIVTHHDITYVRHPESFSRQFRLLYGVMIRPLLRRARQIVTVSEFSKSELVDHYGLDPSRISIVPNAVAGQFHPDPEVVREPFVLAVSSTNQHKNFDRLVEGYRRSRSSADVGLVIVGGTAPSFAQTQSRAGVGIDYVGRVSDDELVRYYQRATLFAFPSLYEGFGIPAIEAQACGTPVVAARAASMPEVLGESVEYVDPLDVDDISRGLDRVLGDASRAEQLSQAGLENSSRYSWRRSAAELSELVDRLNAEPGR